METTKKFDRKGLLFVLILLASVSCTDQFPDVDPEGSLQPDYYSSSEEAAEELLSGSL